MLFKPVTLSFQCQINIAVIAKHKQIHITQSSAGCTEYFFLLETWLYSLTINAEYLIL